LVVALGANVIGISIEESFDFLPQDMKVEVPSRDLGPDRPERMVEGDMEIARCECIEHDGLA
jgi:hypothetical protein